MKLPRIQNVYYANSFAARLAFARPLLNTRSEQMMKKKEAILGQKQVGEVKEGDGEADIITKYQVSILIVVLSQRRHTIFHYN